MSFYTVFTKLIFTYTRLHFRTILFSVMFFLLCLVCISFYLQKQMGSLSPNFKQVNGDGIYYMSLNGSNGEVRIPSISELRSKWIKNKLDKMSNKMKKYLNEQLRYVKEMPFLNYKVHIFYYTWFRTQHFDGFWGHWDINYKVKRDLSSFSNNNLCPKVIASNFFPKHGCYSSRNNHTINMHMKLLKRLGVGVLIVPWLPPEVSDSPDDLMTTLLDTAEKYSLKITLHIEAYDNRNIYSFFNQVKHVITKYGNHPSLYRLRMDNRELPLYYVYASHLISPFSWKELFAADGTLSLRGTKYDGVFVAHLIDQAHGSDIKKGHFDGFYTYNAGNGLTYGSSWKYWSTLKKFARDNMLIFIPCLGPGFTDATQKFISSRNTRHRFHGNYYEVGWRSALASGSQMIAINSFNNWQEGTQIEEAIPKKLDNKVFFDYEPEGSDLYVNLTLWWVRQFSHLPV